MKESLSGKERLKQILERSGPDEFAQKVEDRKTLWISSLDNLYVEIKAWLTEFDSGVVFESRQEPIYEEFVGEYKVPVLTIHFLKINELIALYPKGMFILAAEGKVELWSRFDKVNLIEEKWNEWKIKKITRGKISSIELNQESFLNAISDLVSGQP